MHIAKKLALGLMALLAGCATTPGPRLTLSPLTVPPQALVLVLDGAGGTGITSKSLETVLREQHLPLGVIPFNWTHGWGRFLADQGDVENLDHQGQEFARFVLALRAENPGLPLYVLTFSAGSGVALRAACLVPPDTFERVVFLAPAIAAKADLRPLLLASRRGVDAFTSDRDLFLIVGSAVYGTTGGPRGTPGGQRGFDPVVESQADAALYTAKLRQYPWIPEYAWTGHIGQHNGGHQPKFLATFVVPLFLGRAGG